MCVLEVNYTFRVVVVMVVMVVMVVVVVLRNTWFSSKSKMKQTNKSKQRIGTL